MIESDENMWSDVDSDLSLDVEFAFRAVKEKNGISVGSECMECGSVICHDCMVDWTITTIESFHVPDLQMVQ